LKYWAFIAQLAVFCRQKSCKCNDDSDFDNDRDPNARTRKPTQKFEYAKYGKSPHPCNCSRARPSVLVVFRIMYIIVAKPKNNIPARRPRNDALGSGAI